MVLPLIIAVVPALLVSTMVARKLSFVSICLIVVPLRRLVASIVVLSLGTRLKVYVALAPCSITGMPAGITPAAMLSSTAYL